MRRLVALALGLLVTACPTRPNPNFCQDNDDCQSPGAAGGLCDTRGEFGNSPNTCFDGTPCTDDSECTELEAPICNLEAPLVCRGCREADDCVRLDLSVCEEDGSCSNRCEESAQCADAVPICTDSACTRCESSDQCEERGAAAPYCATGSGACVECLDNSHCSTDAPICDPDTNRCRGCNAHSECTESNTCDLFVGRCVEQNRVLYVRNTEPAGNPCTMDMPCADIGEALMRVVDLSDTIRILGTGTYPRIATTLQNIDVSIFGEGAMISASNGANAVAIGEDAMGRGATVRLQGLTFTGTTPGVNGVRCDSPNADSTVKLLDVEIRSEGTGVICDTCALEIHRSVIQNNEGGGLDINNCNAYITNNQISNNGNGQSIIGGVKIANTGSPVSWQVFALNTVADNDINDTGTAPDGVDCTAINGDALFVGNVLYGGQSAGKLPVQDNAPCVWEYSLIEELVMLPMVANGEGVIGGDPGFIDPPDDYQLGPESPCSDGVKLEALDALESKLMELVYPGPGGEPLDPAFLYRDRAGRVRTSRDPAHRRPVDMGAFERESP